MPPNTSLRSQELNLHFVTVLYLQGHPLPSQQEAEMPSAPELPKPHGVLAPLRPLRSLTPRLSCFPAGAPGRSHLPGLQFSALADTHLVLLQPHVPHADVCVRAQGEQNFFHAFNILPFDLPLERGLGTDFQGISVSKDTDRQ